MWDEVKLTALGAEARGCVACAAEVFSISIGRDAVSPHTAGRRNGDTVNSGRDRVLNVDF